MRKTKREKQEAKLKKSIYAQKKNENELKSLKNNNHKRSKKAKNSHFFDKKKPTTTSDSIPYKRMLKDGICQIDKFSYNKTIRFFDINYQLAKEDDKEMIFSEYASFLNYFDTSVSVQLSFINKTGLTKDTASSIDIKLNDDEFNDIRLEYKNMLIEQQSKGNNGLEKLKYITFGIEAEDLKTAKSRLERLESEILVNFKNMGVKAYALNGYERLELINNIFNPNDNFVFCYDDLKHSGLMTRDYIAPTSLDFSSPKYFKIGNVYGQANFLQILATELSDKMLAEFMDVEEDIIITFHIKSIDQSEAIKEIKRKITDLDKMKIEEQKKAVRSGYDMDIIPSDLQTFGVDAKKLLNDLQSHNERMFVISILLVNTNENKLKLDNTVFQLKSIAGRHNCSLKTLDYTQEQGLMSSLPICNNSVEITRGLTSSSAAIFIPFSTEELFTGGESLYYGLNALSRNIIMADRKMLKNPNGLILGTPGSGKSFAAKREMANSFLITSDDIFICDPEGEYFPLVSALNGQVINISANSKHHINPFDINFENGEDDPIRDKCAFIISLCEQIAGHPIGNNGWGLEGDEISIIDRCVRNIYERYYEECTILKENAANEFKEDLSKMPVLGDFYNEILKQDSPKAKNLAERLELYVIGSQNVFNHRTNVDITNRVVCFDIKELKGALKNLGMLIVQEQVWNRVSLNRNAYKSTRYYIDEFHLLLKDPQTAAYSVEIWKRFRKWGGIPTGITQNVKDLLASTEIENIFDNTDFILMLNQASSDRKILAEKLNISSHQLSYVTNSNEGEGLIFYGNVIVPFVDKFPKNTKLYSLMTTKPSEIKKE